MSTFRFPAAAANAARLAALAIPVALAACATKPVPAPVPTPVAAAPAQMAPAPAPVAMAAPQPAPLAAYLDPNNPVSQKRSVYFAFDNASLRDEDKPVIELQGGYLAKHPELHVRVEGNTDERGGAEYNLALGQRRAQTVKSALEIYGVKDAQVEAISYGAEKPKATGHDEEAWSQNRRADVVYPTN